MTIAFELTRHHRVKNFKLRFAAFAILGGLITLLLIVLLENTRTMSQSQIDASIQLDDCVNELLKTQNSFDNSELTYYQIVENKNGCFQPPSGTNQANSVTKSDGYWE